MIQCTTKRRRLQQNVQLFYFHDGDILRGQPFALVQQRVADAGDLLRRQGIVLGHDGDVGLAALQVDNAVGEALGLDERFKLGFQRNIADAGAELSGQLVFSASLSLASFRDFFKVSSASSRALLRVKRADSKNSVPESWFTLTSWASP